MKSFISFLLLFVVAVVEMEDGSQCSTSSEQSCFAVEPVDQRAELGETAQFYCEVRGTVVIQWIVWDSTGQQVTNYSSRNIVTLSPGSNLLSLFSTLQVLATLDNNRLGVACQTGPATNPTQVQSNVAYLYIIGLETPTTQTKQTTGTQSSTANPMDTTKEPKINSTDTTTVTEEREDSSLDDRTVVALAVIFSVLVFGMCCVCPIATVLAVVNSDRCCQRAGCCPVQSIVVCDTVTRDTPGVVPTTNPSQTPTPSSSESEGNMVHMESDTWKRNGSRKVSMQRDVTEPVTHPSDREYMEQLADGKLLPWAATPGDPKAETVPLNKKEGQEDVDSSSALLDKGESVKTPPTEASSDSGSIQNSEGQESSSLQLQSGTHSVKPKKFDPDQRYVQYPPGHPQERDPPKSLCFITPTGKAHHVPEKNLSPSSITVRVLPPVTQNDDKIDQC